MPNLQDLLNPELLGRIIQQQQQPLPPYQQQTNEYGIPVVYTPPDVVLQGRLRFEARFKHADIAGKTAQQLVDLAYAVVNGNRGPGLPEITTGVSELYQEVHQPYAPAQTVVTEADARAEEAYRRDVIGEFLAELGRSTPKQAGIRESGPAGDIGSSGDSVSGASGLQPAGGIRPTDGDGISDQHHHVEPVADDRQRDDGTPAKPARKSRYHRPKREATEEPKVPQAELIPESHEYWDKD